MLCDSVASMSIALVMKGWADHIRMWESEQLDGGEEQWYAVLQV